MNPLSQSRMYFILINKGWTGGRPFPYLPLDSPSHPLPPSSLSERRTYRVRKFFLFFPLSLFFSLLPSLFSPSRPHLLPPLFASPFYLVRSLINAAVILNVGLQQEMRIPASEHWREKNKDTQWDRTRDLYKWNSSHSPNWTYIYTLWLHLAHFMGVSTILLFWLNRKYKHWWKSEKIYVLIYLHKPIQIIHNKLWYMFETTSLRIKLYDM